MEQSTTSKKVYRPKLSFYHPTSKGNGSVAFFELYPTFGSEEGSVNVKIAKQMTIGDRAHGKMPTFDYEHAVTVKLSFAEVSAILEVLCGKVASVNGDDGLYHSSTICAKRIRFKRNADTGLFVLSVISYPKNQPQAENHGIVFNTSEALGLRIAFTDSIKYLAWGIVNEEHGYLPPLPRE